MDEGFMVLTPTAADTFLNELPPWRNIELMKAKAEELGIDLKERYDYGDTQD